MSTLSATDRSAQRIKTPGMLIAAVLMFIVSATSHALPEQQQPTPAAKQFYNLYSPVVPDKQPARSTAPLTYKLDSGMTVRGIRLSNSFFLTQCKQYDGQKRLGLSVHTGDYLYQLGADYLTVSFLF